MGGILKHRNSEVDFWRLVFAFVVLVHHSHGLYPPDPQQYPFAGGYLAVGFFLILTGYFAAQKTAREKARKTAELNPLLWTVQKFRGIYPYAAFAIILHYLAYALISKSTLYDMVKSLCYGLFEMFLFPAAGLYETFLNLPVWYLSAMLLSLPCFFLMLIKFQENTTGVMCFLSPLLIYGYFSRTAGHLDQWSDWTGLFYVSLIRVWAGLCIGWIVFQLSRRIAFIQFTSIGKSLLSLIELVSMGIVFIYMFTRTHRRLDFLCVGFLIVAISITFSEKAGINRCFSSWWSSIAKYSLALYVSHWTIRMLLPVIMPTASYSELFFPYLMISCLYAVLIMIPIKVMRKYISWDRLKRQVVISEMR